jgi:hypothetical protein
MAVLVFAFDNLAIPQWLEISEWHLKLHEIARSLGGKKTQDLYPKSKRLGQTEYISRSI